ncbi:hypothetical protein DRO60_01215 [Candidatus Bathyarchaeota archaeon]|nr:MAG: hypothetical protein DRO60_01215 [Candidatus Bathyarchaeota archaeon]
MSWLVDALIGIGIQMSAGFIMGFLAGYAAKKVAKVVAVVLGIFILALMLLNYYGIIMVRWEKLVGLGEEALRWIEAQGTSVATFVLMNLPMIGTFTAGFIIGFKKG